VGEEIHKMLTTMEPASMQVDPIEELHLRRWARENYVPADVRNESWHPLILKEMRCRDAEICGERPSPAQPRAEAVGH